jgi:LysR family nitrogen assimilation transcriptional regulator
VPSWSFIGAGDDKRLSSPQCTLKEALQFPLMVPGRPHGNRLQIEWLAESHGFSLKVAMEVDSLTLMIRLLAAGFGYALLPAVAVADELRGGVLRAVTIDPPFTRTLLLGRSARRMTSSRAERLVPLLTKLISEHCDGLDQYGQRTKASKA